MTRATTGPGTLNTLLLVAVVSFSAAHGKLPVYYGQIAENSPAGTVVDGVALSVGGDCNGMKLDTGLEGNYAADFYLVYHRGQRHLVLKSTKMLDREFIAVYDLKAVLRGCLKSAVAIQIEVADENDNIPRFVSENKTIEVDELTPIGSDLARFHARDGDAEKNGRITYYASPKCHFVHVVPQTGHVKLISSLIDVTNVTVHIYAKDHGDVALISEPVTLHLDVRRPALSRVRRPRAVSEELLYTVTVADDVKVGDMIFTVPDQKFDKKWFEVISESDSPVQIERDSGRLYLAHRLKSPAEVMVKIQNLRGKSRAGFHSVRKNMNGTCF